MNLYNISFYDFSTPLLSKNAFLASVKELSQTTQDAAFLVFTQAESDERTRYKIITHLLKYHLGSILSMDGIRIDVEKKKRIKVTQEKSSSLKTLKNRISALFADCSAAIVNCESSLKNSKLRNRIKKLKECDLNLSFQRFFCDCRRASEKTYILGKKLISGYENRERTTNFYEIEYKALRERAFADAAMMKEKPLGSGLLFAELIIEEIKNDLISFRKQPISKNVVQYICQRWNSLEARFPAKYIYPDDYMKIQNDLTMFMDIYQQRLFSYTIKKEYKHRLAKLNGHQSFRKLYENVSLNQILSSAFKAVLCNLISYMEKIVRLKSETFERFEGTSLCFNFLKQEGAIASLKGFRKTNEDAHFAGFIKLQENPAVCLLLCDGHGGAEASAYYKKHFLSKLDKTFKQMKNTLSSSPFHVVMWHALKMTFIHLNECFLKETNHTSGTTAVAGILINGTLYAASCGDSSAILITPDDQRLLLERACTTNKRYRKSVIKRGGYFTGGKFPRVNGKFSLSRAGGDRGYPLSPAPKITWIELSKIPPGSMVALVCDGVTDVNSTEEIASQVRDFSDVQVAARQLVLSSIRDRLSSDNCTAILYKL